MNSTVQAISKHVLIVADKRWNEEAGITYYIRDHDILIYCIVCLDLGSIEHYYGEIDFQ